MALVTPSQGTRKMKYFLLLCALFVRYQFAWPRLFVVVDGLAPEQSVATTSKHTHYWYFAANTPEWRGASILLSWPIYILPAVPQDLTLCSRGDDPLNLGLSLLLCQEHQPHPCCCLGRTAGGARRGRRLQLPRHCQLGHQQRLRGLQSTRHPQLRRVDHDEANLTRNGCSKSCTRNPGLKRWVT